MNKVVEVHYTRCTDTSLLGKTRFLCRGQLFMDVDCKTAAWSTRVYAPDPKREGVYVCNGTEVTDILYLCACAKMSIHECPKTCPQPGAASIKALHTEQATGTAYVDGNPKTAQGAKKHGIHLVPTAALIAESEAFADGVAKYGAANWRERGVAASVYIAAALRHIALYYDGGEDRASDSNAKHLGHARACLGIILDAEACGTLTDDRPTPMPNLEQLLLKVQP